MSNVTVARRYARALLEIASERGIVEQLLEQLTSLSRAFSHSRELRNTMLNPSISLEERQAIIKQLAMRAAWHPIMRNFALLLLDKDRLRVIDAIAADFQALADSGAGRVRAQVTSAVALGPGQHEALKARIAQLTGAKTVELEAKVDQELIGGAITRVGGIVLDGSVRTQLERMRATILQGM